MMRQILWTIESQNDIFNSAWQTKVKYREVESRFIRANKCTDSQSLFDEFSAALQFPFYFSENYNSFNECVGDLDWIEAEYLKIFILNYETILEDEPEARNSLTTALCRAIKEPESDRKVDFVLHFSANDFVLPVVNIFRNNGLDITRFKQ